MENLHRRRVDIRLDQIQIIAIQHIRISIMARLVRLGKLIEVKNILF